MRDWRGIKAVIGDRVFYVMVDETHKPEIHEAWGKVSLLDTSNGHARSVLSVPGAVALVPGPSAAVVTVSHSTTYLLRLAG
jgi:hypothetical protein